MSAVAGRPYAERWWAIPASRRETHGVVPRSAGRGDCRALSAGAVQIGGAFLLEQHGFLPAFSGLGPLAPRTAMGAYPRRDITYGFLDKF